MSKVTMELEQFIKLMNLAEEVLGLDDSAHHIINILHVVITKNELLGGRGGPHLRLSKKIIFTEENCWVNVAQYEEGKKEYEKERNESVRSNE